MKRIEKGLVSTIIPVFNRAEMVVEAVNSVLQQSYRPIEVIVIDDGSTDNTPQILVELSKNNSEIAVYYQDNSGPGVARELGRQNASGEYIQYLDSDDLLLPNKFEQQVNALELQPDCDVAYGKTQLRQLGQPEPSIKTPLKLTGTRHARMFPLFLRSRWWSTSTPLYRRSVTDRAGAWLATINEEDWEYDCRIASQGGCLVYVDDFVSITQRHDQHLSADGTTSVVKLEDRCLARERIYQHGLDYKGEIDNDDWQFFSKAVFLLARECAQLNMKEAVNRLLILAIQARGRSTSKQIVFTFVGKTFGWRMAAKLARLVQA